MRTAEQSGQVLVEKLLAELAGFTGPGWIQEDDITLVAVACTTLPEMPETASTGSGDAIDSWQTLAELEIPSAPDNERLAMEQVAAVVRDIGLTPLRLERLKTAVAEATMNAMEHGNQYRDDQPVQISVCRSAHTLLVRIADYGVGGDAQADAPDLEAKLEGLQTPRGWGLHLIRHMVDDMRVSQTDDRHIVELIVRL